MGAGIAQVSAAAGYDVLLSDVSRIRAEQGKEAIARQLASHTLTMIVAPAAMGKSFVMNRAVELDTEFQRTPVFTTRAARPDDEPGMFRTVPHDDKHVGQILDDIDAQAVVQYAIHPTNATIYGTVAGDYESKRYNLLATQSNAVASLEQAGFEQTYTVGLIASPGTWQQWFERRYRGGDQAERGKRLAEAVLSLDWLLAQPDIAWLINDEGQGEQAAKELVAISRGDSKGSDPELSRAYAQRITQLIRPVSR